MTVTKFGRYELLERISVGGMAEVFKGRVSGAAGFEKIVAIKRILPHLSDDQEFISMFVDEAKLSANLNHSNIGQVFEFGKIDNRYFIAMEFIHGKDLRRLQDYFRSFSKSMPVPMAIRVMLEVCNALEYAHSKRDDSGQLLRIVHRDISPQNVLISYEGAVKIIDFGIAKALSRSTKTAVGNLKGKFGYMSPEQVDGEEVDGRSDLFAAGTVLWELVTGQRLFSGESELATLEKVRTAEVVAPSSVNPSLPKTLDTVVMKALARRPAERYQKAEEMHEALERFAQTSRLTFSSKQLSRWMKSTFAAELEADDATRTDLDATGEAAPAAARPPLRPAPASRPAPRPAPAPESAAPARPASPAPARPAPALRPAPRPAPGPGSAASPAAPRPAPGPGPALQRPAPGPSPAAPRPAPGPRPVTGPEPPPRAPAKTLALGHGLPLPRDPGPAAPSPVASRATIRGIPPRPAPVAVAKGPSATELEEGETRVSPTSAEIASKLASLSPPPAAPAPPARATPAPRPSPSFSALAPEPMMGQASDAELGEQSDTIVQLDRPSEAPAPVVEIVLQPGGMARATSPVSDGRDMAPTIAPGMLDAATVMSSAEARTAASAAGASSPALAPSAALAPEAGLGGDEGLELDDGPTTIDAKAVAELKEQPWFKERLAQAAAPASPPPAAKPEPARPRPAEPPAERPATGRRSVPPGGRTPLVTPLQGSGHFTPGGRTAPARLDLDNAQTGQLDPWAPAVTAPDIETAPSLPNHVRAPRPEEPDPATSLEDLPRGAQPAATATPGGYAMGVGAPRPQASYGVSASFEFLPPSADPAPGLSPDDGSFEENSVTAATFGPPPSQSGGEVSAVVGGLSAVPSEGIFRQAVAEEPEPASTPSRGWVLWLVLGISVVVLLAAGATAVYFLKFRKPSVPVAAKNEPKKPEEPKKVAEPEEPKKVAEPKKPEEPKKVVEPKKPEEPKKVAEPKKPEEPKKVAEPKKKPEPKVAEPKKKPEPKVAEPKKKPEPKKVAEPKKKPEPKKVAEPKKKPEPKVAAGKTGFLIVSSVPWAKIYVDGKDIGRNTPVPPVNPLKLPAGPHKITLEVEKKRFTFPVVIKAGETARLIQKLPVSR